MPIGNRKTSHAKFGDQFRLFGMGGGVLGIFLGKGVLVGSVFFSGVK